MVTPLEAKTGPVLMNIPSADPDLRSKLIPRCWGLVSFLPQLPGKGTKERWVGVQAPGLRGCALQISTLFPSAYLPRLSTRPEES